MNKNNELYNDNINYNIKKTTNNFREKSLEGRPIKKDSIKHDKIVKKEFKKKIIIFALCAAAIGATVKVTSDSAYQYNTICEYVQENNLDIVHRNTHRTNDNKYYYYDNENIAREILNSDNQEFTIYLCFMDMDKATAPKYGEQELRNMNEVFKELNRLCNDGSIYKDYNTFEDYLIMNGYCKSDGTADYALYDNYSRERLLRLIENEKKEKSY